MTSMQSKTPIRPMAAVDGLRKVMADMLESVRCAGFGTEAVGGIFDHYRRLCRRKGFPDPSTSRSRTVDPGLHGAPWAYRPTKAHWYPAFRAELLSFPAGKHDDQVDAMGLIGQLLDTMGRGREIAAAREKGVNAHNWGDHGRPILAEPDATQGKNLKSREPCLGSGVSFAGN
jgi:hypothetical protein